MDQEHLFFTNAFGRNLLASVGITFQHFSCCSASCVFYEKPLILEPGGEGRSSNIREDMSLTTSV